jgi:hypothetical protein
MRDARVLGPGCNLAITATHVFNAANFLGWRARVLKRPKKREIRYPNKPKALDSAHSKDELEEAAVNARYVPSDYHCKQANGRPPKRRAKPAMHCPRDWSIQQALVAVRAAIRAKRVSRRWINGFPRHIWHKEGDVWYEARTETGTAGVYHAYPIEITGLPAGLEQ